MTSQSNEDSNRKSFQRTQSAQVFIPPTLGLQDQPLTISDDNLAKLRKFISPVSTITSITPP